ncbi:hypothetical protein NVP1139A_50 [Vibrio phage 1.139.A._10N.261.48.C6]|nr:hypothetical protein NVP1034O_49 [Vibrio phage 1.034.O._10N.261.46.B7]AUR83480.1 hypothetical protein NVP1034X_50 [Vibrio phage 1.034.X._10N.261.46.B7]AUR90218.1 hypothetical protein NVP1139A_50 [Vibrio phage 1.139.A._10N.261.48.C6]AUR90285.1 hypothetical protein NVP1139B_50 [Vibrio phage 1.139.B._10N.261.48.C6]AUR95606.1 hypothetical protein NVP1209O_49 [Vibrio phage 1.209.O._10N.222.52.B2]
MNLTKNSTIKEWVAELQDADLIHAYDRLDKSDTAMRQVFGGLPIAVFSRGTEAVKLLMVMLDAIDDECKKRGIDRYKCTKKVTKVEDL